MDGAGWRALSVPRGGMRSARRCAPRPFCRNGHCGAVGHGAGAAARFAVPALPAGAAGQVSANSIALMARRLGIGSSIVGNFGPGARGGLIGNSGIVIRIEDEGPDPASFTPRTETRVPSSGVGLNHVDRTPVIPTVGTAGVQRPSAIRSSQRSPAGVGRKSAPRHHRIVTLVSMATEYCTLLATENCTLQEGDTEN